MNLGLGFRVIMLQDSMTVALLESRCLKAFPHILGPVQRYRPAAVPEAPKAPQAFGTLQF